MTIVRTATAADVPALRAVAEAAYRGYPARIGRPPAPMTADYAAAVAGGHTWVAARDGAVVGLLVLVPRPGHLLLENVAVLPAEQGRGTGSRLLELAEEQARQQGLPEIRRYANEAMTENIRHYGRRGYTETHRARDEGFARVFSARPCKRHRARPIQRPGPGRSEVLSGTRPRAGWRRRWRAGR